MSGDFLLNGINKTIQAFALRIEQFALVAFEVIDDIRSVFFQKSSSWKTPIEFTPLQWTLLKLLLCLLFCTIVLIGYYWKIYGKVITEKFVRPSTLKEIEELKFSVAKLKLPKEHSPRI